MDYRESRFLAYCDCIIGPLLPIFDWCVLTLAPVIFLEVARASWPWANRRRSAETKMSGWCVKLTLCAVAMDTCFPSADRKDCGTPNVLPEMDRVVSTNPSITHHRLCWHPQKDAGGGYLIG